MEKSTTEYAKHFQRLLSFLFALVYAIFSTLFLSAEEVNTSMQKLHIFPQQEYCFTDTDCQFSLRLEGVAPENVQSYVDTIPENASFISSRKDELAGNEASEGQKGTMIQLWFRFKKTGTYQLNPLAVEVSGKMYKVPFDPIAVYENQETVQPQVSLTFYNQTISNTGGAISCHRDEHIRFTVYIKYAVQIIAFDWNIPQNSIFKEIKQYEITKELPRGNSFSPDEVPIATFDWQPFAVGDSAFPDITITATAYNGSRVNLILPQYTVTVLPPLAAKPETESSVGVFAYAFAEPEDEAVPQNAPVIDAQNVKTLLQLRGKERHSLPFNSFAKQCRAIEEQKGLATGENEPSIPLFVLLLVLTLFVTAVSVFLLVLKKLRSASVCIVFNMVFVIGTILCGVQVSRQFALFTGGTVSPIPEVAASSSVVMQTGSRVEVQREAGEWAYIKYNDTYGWVLKSKIDYIK